MAVNTTVEVTMPQMGDSVSEGTILEWHIKEGDAVSEDQVLVEISTDKVDAEVPSPTAGTVVKTCCAWMMSTCDVRMWRTSRSVSCAHSRSFLK